ncbi:TonB-dependent receptor [Maribacter sp. 2307ULW6-5]|uniref:TonB-dependent receptor n=1 Tax=Maribacter sp. 2307ULW6-5 TaxID=3386275 RepID=UPI0039BD8A16
MRQSIFLLFLFACHGAAAQTTISGQLTDASGLPIANASVVANKTGTTELIAYDISNGAGNYKITVVSAEENFDLEIRSMGHATLATTIANQNGTHNFTLQDQPTELEEVVVEASPIVRKGDTLDYSVHSFAKEQDRTLKDVLQRMPGIEVLADGKILYQGTPINKYYIEGLDLLEGKYDLANENLPYREVAKVQVLENHQPVRVLDSLVHSDKAALNIKLKNEYTVTGQAALGSGMAPLLWDANVTPLLFTKKEQLLVSYQANNTGTNSAAQLKRLTIEDLLNQFENNTEKKDWLGIQQLGTPNFSEERWLDNNVHLLTGNYLHKLKNDYELRLNTSYLNDRQQQTGATSTLFFTPTDTIALLEQKNNELFHNSLEMNLTLQKNTEKNYLKNSVQFQGFWDGQRGNISTNGVPLLQDVGNRHFRLSNTFQGLFRLGKQLTTLNSYVGLNRTPQTLGVSPGQFQNLLNNGDAYEEVLQEVHLRTFHTNNSLGLTKGWKHFSFSPSVGFQFEDQNLATTMTTSENQGLPALFGNDLDWRRSKLYVLLKSQFKKEGWRLELTTPVNFHSYGIEDGALLESESLNLLTFEPRLAVVRDANAFWKYNASASLTNTFGTIDQLHYAYILRNYRTIQRINTPLPQIANTTITGGISYRNPITSLFWNVLLTQTSSKHNLLYQTRVLDNGTTEIQAVERDNDRINHNLSARGSKYFGKLNTTATLNANAGLQRFVQIINGTTTDIDNENLGFGAKLDTDLANWLNVAYEAHWMFSKNRVQGQPNNTIFQQSHLLNLNFYLKENQFFGLNTEYLRNELLSGNAENLFADFLYRYTYKKKNIDVELRCANIFNTQTYGTININEFRYVETNFQLRPRQVLFVLRFSI